MRTYPRKRKLVFNLPEPDNWLPEHQLPWVQKPSRDLFQPYLVMPYGYPPQNQPPGVYS